MKKVILLFILFVICVLIRVCTQERDKFDSNIESKQNQYTEVQHGKK
jgi:hypothetical protein